MTYAAPRGIEWFRNAKFGLFMHYGVYSQLGKAEWVQWCEKMPVAEYEKLKDTFTAEDFDADFITDLALEAEMKYVNLTSMHHDGFCLFDTAETDFNSVNSPAKRDLVGELAEQCHKKGLGLCLYYSHGRHWRHPHTMRPEEYDESARPQLDTPDPHYATGEDYDIGKYVTYCQAQVTELLTNYGPIANIWFDGWCTPMAGPWETQLHIPELYETIRRLQPECLISYKWGITGTEDFYAPEIHWPKGDPEHMEQAVASGKPIEVCQHIAGWGYFKEYDGKHRGVDSVMEDLDYASQLLANLLLNTAPLPDGAIDRQDIATLRKVGKRLRAGR
ncbi:MAG: alpha-L-fucosidase [Planctomycetota bacterium]